MAFVLDASVAGCWAFGDEDHPVAAEAFDRLRSEDALTSSLWWFELRNLLLVNERRGRIGEADVGLFLRRLASLPILVDRQPDEVLMLNLARRHRLTVYDAAYLELAMRENTALATLDAALTRAAQSEGVTLLGVSAAV